MPKLVKSMLVRKIVSTRFNNQQFTIVVESGETYLSTLNFSKESLVHHQIPFSLDLVGRHLRCTFESSLLPSIWPPGAAFSYFDTRGLLADSLMINQIERLSTKNISLDTEEFHPEVEQYILRMQSFYDDSSSIVPCPHYDFVVELEELEYKECMSLSPGNIFSVSFAVE